MGFVTGPAGEKFTLNVEGCDTVENVREQVENLAGYECDYLVHGTAILGDEQTLNEAGVEAEAHIEAHCTVEGGKRKRKKKKYTTPKKVKHCTKRAPRRSLSTTRLTSLARSRDWRWSPPTPPSVPTWPIIPIATSVERPVSLSGEPMTRVRDSLSRPFQEDSPARAAGPRRLQHGEGSRCESRQEEGKVSAER